MVEHIQPNLIFPQQDDVVIPIEIKFTERKGLIDRKFRDEVIDEIYDTIFTSLKVSSFGMAFKNNYEIISFNLIYEKNNEFIFSLIYEKLLLLRETEPKFNFRISGIPTSWLMLFSNIVKKIDIK